MIKRIYDRLAKHVQINELVKPGSLNVGYTSTTDYHTFTDYTTAADSYTYYYTFMAKLAVNGELVTHKYTLDDEVWSMEDMYKAVHTFADKVMMAHLDALRTGNRPPNCS